jgi:hypothetical protein
VIEHAGHSLLLQARKIRNQATINEDPRTQVIRKLREEVIFLKQQLSASQHSFHVKKLTHGGGAEVEEPAPSQDNKITQAPIPGTEYGRRETHPDAQHEQSAAGGCRHFRDRHVTTSKELGEAESIGRSGSDMQQTRTHIGEHDGEPQADCNAGSQSVLACKIGAHTEASGLVANSNMIMEPLDKALCPGHLATKELVEKIVRYAEVAKGLHNSVLRLNRSHDELIEANSLLRSRFLAADQELVSLRTCLSTCEAENVELRELGTLLSSVVKVHSP